MTRPSKRRNGARKPRTATRVKIAISLPGDQVAAAVLAVKNGRASSVSAYVAQALERQADVDALGELIAVMRAEDGAPAADDYAWADAALGISGRAQKRVSR